MSTEFSVPKKRGGRPRLLSIEDEARIARLYFEEMWTALRIQEEFPALSLNGIREIARRHHRQRETS